MWTQENRARYDRNELRYPSDLTDAEWAIIAPLIPPGKRGGDKRTVNLREVLTRRGGCRQGRPPPCRGRGPQPLIRSGTPQGLRSTPKATDVPSGLRHCADSRRKVRASSALNLRRTPGTSLDLTASNY